MSKMTTEEIREVEGIVNAQIRRNIPVVIREMPRDEAIALGAMALFGEKYGEVVRVVTIDPNFSVELCGGTHAGSTGELGHFAIASESAVAAGVRRVEAVCGAAAEAWLQERLGMLDGIRSRRSGRSRRNSPPSENMPRDWRPACWSASATNYSPRMNSLKGSPS
jgi:alanyl-tRNA synthetase